MTSDPVKQYKNLDYNLCSNLSVSGFRIINVISVHETFKIYSTSNSDQPMMKAADHISLKTFQEKKISCRCLGQVKIYFLTLFHPKIELLQLKNLPKEDFVIFVLECGSLQLARDHTLSYKKSKTWLWCYSSYSRWIGMTFNEAAATVLLIMLIILCTGAVTATEELECPKALFSFGASAADTGNQEAAFPFT
jgi:hypothetical protein